MFHDHKSHNIYIMILLSQRYTIQDTSSIKWLIWRLDGWGFIINPLNAKLNPVCYLLALLAHHFLHVSRIRVNTRIGIGPVTTASRMSLNPTHRKCWHYFWYVLFFRFKQAGGQVVEKTVTKLQDLENNFDVVMNCAGLGAKYLCSDNKMVPIRGQVVKVLWALLLINTTH